MADLLAKGTAASGETGARGVAGKPCLACSYIEKQLASSPCIEEATLGQASFHGGRQIWDKDNSATLGQLWDRHHLTRTGRQDGPEQASSWHFWDRHHLRFSGTGIISATGERWHGYMGQASSRLIGRAPLVREPGGVSLARWASRRDDGQANPGRPSNLNARVLTG